ncbi:uroporphyrinogen-III synthase [Ktedonobacteria bacterium brp13]|nr:uroporphyrinogen-III synthase [Ktedonobacteria bacterium brp13]
MFESQQATSGIQSATPLQGKRVLVTRTREQASALSERLLALGATPIEFPTIRIVPPTDWTQLDAALRRLYAVEYDAYDWLVLTSANGVHICMQRVRALGYDPAALRVVRIATIGPATAAALEQYGLQADLVPDDYIAEGVVRALLADAQRRDVPIKGQRILLARAAEARKILFTELQEAGALVDEVPAYYTHTVASDDERGQEILRLLRERQLAIITFTSSSTVRNFVAWLHSCVASDPASSESAENASDTTAILALVNQNTKLASIGPITSQTARELGLTVTIEASEFTIEGLVNAIVNYEGDDDGHN